MESDKIITDCRLLNQIDRSTNPATVIDSESAVSTCFMRFFALKYFFVLTVNREDNPDEHQIQKLAV